jgi:transposase
MSYVTKPSAIFGADIAKDEVMVQRHAESSTQRLRNAPKPLMTWLAQLPPDALVVMEATNTYHELLATLAHLAGVQVAVLNPRCTWHYARSLGVRGKTDRVDTDTLSDFGANQWKRLHRWEPPTAGNARVAKLLRRRGKLVHAKVALGQSLSTVKELSSLRRQTQQTLARLIDRVDLLIVKVVSQDQQLAPLYRRLQTIVGVGPILAAQLTQALTRMRWTNQDAFVAYTGLDPRPKDSGTRRGQRKLTKYGPPMLRHLLFMGAMSAVKTPLYKPMYRALLDRGLKTTQALVVVARRIARIAFAMFTTGQVFDPRRLSPAPQNA